MPFRNCTTHLSEVVWRTCLESMRSQTFDDWQCILVDDCSTDDSLDVVKSYEDSRFIVVSNQEHIGLTKSLNRAISLVKTPYIARHDSDDFSSKKRLAKQMAFMKNNDSISVVGTYARVYSPQMVAYDTQDKPIIHRDIQSAIRRENPMIHGSVLIRTDDLKELNGYDESFYVCQDYELWSRFVLAGKLMQNMPEYLYNRVSHKTCASKTYSSFRKDALRRIRAMHKR